MIERRKAFSGRVATENHSTSYSPHPRTLGLPLNPVECEICDTTALFKQWYPDMEVEEMPDAA